MLSYLKVFADAEAYVERLSDEERGRLFGAMMAYAFRGEESDLPGNEGFVWPVFRRMIDLSEKKVETLRANGSAAARRRRGAGQDEADESKPEQSEANASKPPPLHEQEQEYDQEQEHAHEQEQEEQQEDARALARRYGLPESPAALRALREDLAAHGREALERALAQASESNSRPMLSVNFYRAVLRGDGRPRNSGYKEPMQRHHYTDADYEKLYVVFDEEKDENDKEGKEEEKHDV